MSNAFSEYERRHRSIAVSAQIRAFEGIVARSRSDRKKFQEKLQQHIAVLEKIFRVFVALGNPKTAIIRLDTAELRFFLESHDTVMNELESLLLQSAFQHMAEFHDEQTREQIWKNHQFRFGEHIQPCQTLKPATEVTSKLPDSQSRFSNLPPEILAAIFNACDLETCVNLREVDSAWYLLFQRSDLILKQKMAVRNPWITPSDDFRTWRDCALVFVTRLKTWHNANHLDSIHIEPRQGGRKTVVGMELKRNEKLSPNFSIMADSHGCPYSCQHMHVIDATEQHCFTRDPWTLETSNESDSHAVVYVEDDKTIIEVTGDVRVTLPSSFIKPEEITDSQPLKETESFLVVNLKNGLKYAMPRDQPHYENGMDIPAAYDIVSDVGGILVCWNRENFQKFFAADFQSKTFKEFTMSEETRLDAFYNGLMWWKKKDRKVLIPTFVDLEDPDKVYYSANRAITGVAPYLAAQCSRARAAQFCIGSGGDDTIDIVDMARGIVTNVLSPIGYGVDGEDRTNFLGWFNGQFQALMMNPDDVWEIQEEVFQKYGIPEEDW